MLINFVDATNDANHYTKPPPKVIQGHRFWYQSKAHTTYLLSGTVSKVMTYYWSNFR